MSYLPLFLGLVLGAATAWILLKGKMTNLTGQARAEFEPQLATLKERLASREQTVTEQKILQEKTSTQLEDFRREITVLRTSRAELETTLAKERKAAEEKLALLHEAQQELSHAFQALAAEALKSNNQAFLDLARSTLEKFQETAKGDLEKRQQAIEQFVKPVQASLEKFDTKLQEMEKTRVGAYEGLTQQVKSMLDTQIQLRSETANLVKALRAPQGRGRWGEIQLKRVVELAGMVEYCDFTEQEHVSHEEGDVRPDLVVKLPGGKNIVVDAKAPLSAYLEAIEEKDENSRQLHLDRHARQIRDHIAKLGKKSYWEKLQPTPEFVVLFIPGDTFLSAALERDPSLLELGMEQRVLLATPSSLIAMLKAVAYGWRQETLAANARQISDLGKELYQRLATVNDHVTDVGKHLDKAVDSYNKAVSSLESRVLVSARKFRDLEAAGSAAEITAPAPIDKVTHRLQAPEFSPAPATAPAALPLPGPAVPAPGR